MNINNPNLKSWPKGTSGNPSGRPVGTRNVKTIIRELLEDKAIYDTLPNSKQYNLNQTPIEAIVSVLIVKSLDGNLQAISLLLNHLNIKDEKNEHDEGFFSQRELLINVVNSENLQNN